MVVSYWCQHDIHSLISHAREASLLRCPSQRNSSIVGMLNAKSLSIVWGSDSRYWKSTALDIGGESTEVTELINVCWLHIDGIYEVKNLRKGMHYEVKFVVKLLEDVKINNSVTLRLTPPGECTQVYKKKLMKMERNKIIGITAGEFQARDMKFGGQIKFSMTNDDDCWKHGMVVIGVLVVPKL